MDQSFLKILPAFLFVALMGLEGCSLFDDAVEELDPALRDSSLTLLSTSEQHPVVRYNLLESYGSFGCVSCPEAESRLSPYMHPELGNPAYNPRLVIVNYHVKFGSISDPWITPTVQSLHDALGYVSLPQAVMNGSNATYAIREKDVAFKIGEYDSLVARVGRTDSTAWLELVLDTNQIEYDSTANQIRFSFTARNHRSTALGSMDFRVLAVKNQSVRIPIYPSAWEAIVIEATQVDKFGNPLQLAGLSSLTAKTFPVALKVPQEAPKHVLPPPLGPEKLDHYAIVVVARDAQGKVLNLAFIKYRPL